MGNFSQLRETCFWKTGRDGVVLEFCDNFHPNIFMDNSFIESSIFDKYSKIKVTLVDARKTSDKGKAIYYNLDPGEIILIAFLLSDGDDIGFKARTGAFNKLSGQTQIIMRQLVSTFQSLDWSRFDRKLKSYSQTSEPNNMLTLQKNFEVANNQLNVRKLIISYEDAMRSSSKWKITIEEGTGIKDQKSNGLNIIKSGSYKMNNKSFLMLQEQELVVPIYEAAKRVFIAQETFYPIMKNAEKQFTAKKIKAKDYCGDRINEWNIGALPKKEPKEQKEKPENNHAPNSEKNTNTSSNDTMVCSICNSNLDQATFDFSLRNCGKPLCREHQTNNINKNDNQQIPKVCSTCGENLNDKVFNFSMRKFNKPLCLKHQK